MADDHTRDSDSSGAKAEAPGALENHPGAPRPRDEIDPELIKLRRMRISVGPITSAAIIVFCGYMMVRLYGDLRFSRQDSEPRRVTVADVVSGRAGNEGYVAMGAVPDRAFAMRVLTKGSTEGHRVAPVLGSDAHLWLVVGSEPWAEPIAYQDDYRGRLRRLSDMPFADALESYVHSREATPQSVTGEALRKAVAAHAAEVIRPSGDHVKLDAGTRLGIRETVPDRALVRGFFREDRLPDEAAWNAALTAAGVLPEGARANSIDDEAKAAVYEVPAPDGLAGIKQKLVDARLFAARAEPVVREYETTFSGLTSDAAGLHVAGGAVVPWDSVSDVVVYAPRQVPPGAQVLVTDEAPGAYWYVLPLYLLLALFVALFSWALVRALRPEREPQRASKQAESAA